MAVKVAINGFGRIGRIYFRGNLERLMHYKLSSRLMIIFTIQIVANK